MLIWRTPGNRSDSIEDQAMIRTTSAMLERHQQECTERYKETARQLQILNNLVWRVGGAIIAGLAYLALHSKGLI